MDSVLRRPQPLTASMPPGRDFLWSTEQTWPSTPVRRWAVQGPAGTLLSFSPSVCGMRVFSDWNPALMLCMRRRSLLLAISLRIRRSWSRCVSGVSGMLAKLWGRRWLTEGLGSPREAPRALWPPPGVARPAEPRTPVLGSHNAQEAFPFSGLRPHPEHYACAQVLRTLGWCPANNSEAPEFLAYFLYGLCCKKGLGEHSSTQDVSKSHMWLQVVWPPFGVRGRCWAPRRGPPCTSMPGGGCRPLSSQEAAGLPAGPTQDTPVSHCAPPPQGHKPRPPGNREGAAKPPVKTQTSGTCLGEKRPLCQHPGASPHKLVMSRPVSA